MRDGRAGWNEIAEIYDRTRAFPGDGERAVHGEDDVRRAADVAERRLVAEGADLDAQQDAPVDVRLVIGRLQPGSERFLSR